MLRLARAALAASMFIDVQAGAPSPVPEDFRLELRRGTCEGTCPGYSVAVDARGRVTWDGQYFVERKGSAKKVVPREVVETVVRRVEETRFMALQDGGRRCLDSPDVAIEVTLNGRTKRVVHDSCSERQPEEGQRVAELARHLDALLGTEVWVGRVR
jgi:hypothetical protein